MQFVESECEVLPSKERCPYLVVAEMIEQPFTSKSEEIYTQGAYVCACVRLYCRPDDRSSSGECYKGEETIFLTPSTLGSRKGYQTIGGLQQISDLAPSHPLYCSVSTGHPIGVTVEDIINGRTLHHDSSRRNIETQYSPSQMADFAGKAE